MRRVLSLFLAVALMLGVACVAPSAQAAGKKLIAITYDDGPSKDTERLLDGLQERGIKATFFLIGWKVPANEKTVSRMYREGHQVANHSYDHPHLTQISDEKIRWQIQETNACLDKVCGKGTAYVVRPPYGAMTEAKAKVVNQPCVAWSYSPRDWIYTDAPTIKKSLLENAKDGDVILVHDTVPGTIDATLEAIDELTERGFEFVTVQELFRRRGRTLHNGGVYGWSAVKGADLGPVEVPKIISQPEGNKLRITMTAQSGASIYYTMSGDELNQESTRYTGPFLVSDPCTVKAVAAFNMNGSRSDVVEKKLAPVTAAPEIRVKNGLLIIESETAGAQIYYSLQGAEFLNYTVPVAVERGTEISAYAQGEDYQASSITTASYSSRGNLFRDVFPHQWYYEEIDRAVTAGYMNGVGNDRYDPNGRLQRGQFMVLLYRYSGEAAEPGAVARLPFKDVPENAYYAEAVAWAYEKGIVNGMGPKTFGPSRAATRQEMSKIFYGYLRTLDAVQPDGSGSANQYADKGKIASWAYEAVEQMTAMGLLNGEEKNSFNPTGTLTRAQGVTVLVRLADYMESHSGADGS